MGYYPVLVDVTGQRCVVIGGGEVAEGKVAGLLEAGASVVVIAPKVTLRLREWIAVGRVDHIPRNYQPGDLDGALLVISATDDPAVNQAVWAEATAKGILVNVVDDPPRCRFIAPAVVRQGDLIIAISTSGKAPALAVRLRQWLERALGPEYARFLELVGPLRDPLLRRYPDLEERKRRWYRLVDSDVFALLRAGDERTARHRIHEILGLEEEQPIPVEVPACVGEG